jgi:hypothetical protein
MYFIFFFCYKNFLSFRNFFLSFVCLFVNNLDFFYRKTKKILSQKSPS